MVASFDGSWHYYLNGSPFPNGFSFDWLLSNIFSLKDMYFTNGRLFFMFYKSIGDRRYELALITKKPQSISLKWLNEMDDKLKKYFPKCKLSLEVDSKLGPRKITRGRVIVNLFLE